MFQVNECRRILFSKKNRGIEFIPPTQAALQQHLLRTLYQGGHVWGQSTTLQPMLPNPCDFGWRKENDCMKPFWTTLPSAAVSCDELISCGCKTSCRGLCKCFRASLPCTALCGCDGDCFENREIPQEVEEDCEIDQTINLGLVYDSGENYSD